MREANIAPGVLAAAVGVTPGAVSKWLADVATPTFDNLRIIARVCGVGVERLMPAEDAA